ncbi:MAG: hypothetical protein LBL58_02625 [Tannerellaceae bacterium]|jgi:hypothetical protein|nr:hypothetical protein [Tannerellaceae bacterium]
MELTKLEDHTIVNSNRILTKNFHQYNGEFSELVKDKISLFLRNNPDKLDYNSIRKIDIRIPIASTPNIQNYTTQVQNWIGYIIEIKNDVFIAKLIDITDPTTNEYAEFDFNEVSQEDLNRIRIGSIFYWSIGFEYKFGQKTKFITLRFRRSPLFDNSDEFDKIVDRASELNRKITWE